MRTQRWLRILGLGTWLVAGSTSIVRFAGPFNHPGWTWVGAFVSFGLVFLTTSDRRTPRPLRVVGLAAQAALAVLLAFLGMPAFEGALLALVAAQVPMVLPLWVSAPWAALQAVPLWIVLAHTRDNLELAKSVSSYLGFAAFATGAVHLFEAEHRARVELDRTVGELVATRTMLAESTRIAERARISRDLHDVLGHHLVALSLKLDLARRTAAGDARAALDELYGVVQQMLKDVRATVHALRSEDAVDLGSALRALLRRIPELEAHVDLPEELTIAEPERAHAAFRCVQEALTNVLKHADATNVWISGRHEAGDLELRVDDDGRGARALEPGKGLRGMRERIEGVGGKLEVMARKGGGTTVLARIPTKEDQ